VIKFADLDCIRAINGKGSSNRQTCCHPARGCRRIVSCDWKKDIRAIIEEAFPGAIITEIEKEKYRGKKVYEVDFKHDGKKLEAIISLEGEIFKIGIDDKDLFCAQKYNSARGPRLNPVCLKTL